MYSEAKILHYTVREVAPYINWVYYFHAWGMEPRFAAIADVHDCPSCRSSWVASFPAEERAKAREAMKLYDEAMELLRRWANEPICHALFLLADAYSEGDDIVVNGTTRIPFLRQQQAGKTGYTLCLSDFIKNADENDNENLKRNNLKSTSSPLPPSPINDISHTIGLFATTVSPPLNLQPSTLNPQPSPTVLPRPQPRRCTRRCANTIGATPRRSASPCASYTASSSRAYALPWATPAYPTNPSSSSSTSYCISTTSASPSPKMVPCTPIALYRASCLPTPRHTTSPLEPSVMTS